MVTIPDKLYFKIGEVSKIADLPAHVLRFWETEFSQIKPKRSPSGQRLYRRKDVELVLKIKHLLYDKKFTIRGALKHLRNNDALEATQSPGEVLDDIRRELETLRNLLT